MTQSTFIRVCDKYDRLLFKYDPQRRVVSIKRDGVVTDVDLARFDNSVDNPQPKR